MNNGYERYSSFEEWKKAVMSKSVWSPNDIEMVREVVEGKGKEIAYSLNEKHQREALEIYDEAKKAADEGYFDKALDEYCLFCHVVENRKMIEQMNSDLDRIAKLAKQLGVPMPSDEYLFDPND